METVNGAMVMSMLNSAQQHNAPGTDHALRTLTCARAGLLQYPARGLYVCFPRVGFNH